MNEITLQQLLQMGLKPPVGWLYLHMAARSQNDMLDATIQDMAAWVGVTRQTARNYLLKLESKSLIQDVGGGRYVVRGLVHPPTPSFGETVVPRSVTPDVKIPNIKPDSNVKHSASDSDSADPNVKHATGSDVKTLNILPESESKTLSISDSDSDRQTPAADVKPETVPTRTVTSEAVALWGEMPKSWHGLIDGYVSEFGAAWVLAAIRLGQSKSGEQKPRHPRWVKAVIENGIREGKTAETLGSALPHSFGETRVPRSVTQPPSARGNNAPTTPSGAVGQGGKSQDKPKVVPPMPDDWWPQGWIGQDKTLADRQISWVSHYRLGYVS